MSEKLRRVVVIPDGDVSFTDGTSVKMDAKAANQVIDAFDEYGNDLPFDYEHATTVKGDEAERAPAAGWIKRLTYEKSKGLVAHVAFLPEAEKDIEDKKYRYVSPVFWKDENGRPRRLHSCALTNTPKTQSIPEILAAKTKAPDAMVCSFEYDGMDETDSTVNAMHEAATALSALKRLLKMAGVDTSDWTPDQVIEGGAQALDQLVSAMESNDMADDKSTAKDTPAAVPTTGKENAVKDGILLVQLREVLNLEQVATPQDVVNRIRELQLGKVGMVSADEHAKVVARLDEIEAEGRRAKIEPRIAEWIRQNKLNGNEPDQVQAVRDWMYRDSEGCEKFMSRQNAIVQPGAYMSAAAGGSTRERVIAKAKRDWESDPKTRQYVPSKSAWVNQELRDNQHETLTADEAARL